MSDVMESRWYLQGHKIQNRQSTKSSSSSQVCSKKNDNTLTKVCHIFIFLLIFLTKILFSNRQCYCGEKGIPKDTNWVTVDTVIFHWESFDFQRKNIILRNILVTKTLIVTQFRQKRPKKVSPVIGKYASHRTLKEAKPSLQRKRKWNSSHWVRTLTLDQNRARQVMVFGLNLPQNWVLPQKDVNPQFLLLLWESLLIGRIQVNWNAQRRHSFQNIKRAAIPMIMTPQMRKIPNNRQCVNQTERMVNWKTKSHGNPLVTARLLWVPMHSHKLLVLF